MLPERRVGASEMPRRARQHVSLGAERRCNLYPRSAIRRALGAGKPPLAWHDNRSIEPGCALLAARPASERRFARGREGHPSPMNRLFGVRPEERRIVWVGFATLLTIVAGHTVLETARDALSRADLPASRLPWAYLGIAVLAFAATRLLERFLGGRSARRALAGMLVAGGGGAPPPWGNAGRPGAGPALAR